MRFHRLRDREVAGDGGDRPNEVSGSGSGVAAEDDDMDEERDGAVGSERADATSVRQIWMRSCFAGGMRGLFLMTGWAFVRDESPIFFVFIRDDRCSIGGLLIGVLM